VDVESWLRYVRVEVELSRLGFDWLDVRGEGKRRGGRGNNPLGERAA
jgi:hypothetical protein